MKVAPYQPPRLDPDLALLQWAMGLTAPYDFILAGAPARLTAALAGGGPWPAAARLHLEIGGYLWTVELADLGLLEQIPALAGTNPGALPESFHLAALDWIFRPLWAGLAAILGTGVSLVSAPPADPERPDVLEMALTRPGPDGTEAVTAIRFRPAGPLAARRLAEALFQALPRRSTGLSLSCSVWVSLAAGRMRLPARLLAGLAVGDVLLPPEYSAAQGTLWLDLPGGRASVRLAASDGEAKVIDILMLEEPMPEAQKSESQQFQDRTPPEPTSESWPALQSEPETVPAVEPAAFLADLELTVTFELERKLMTLAELSALAPGAAFPLGTDPLAPVTLTSGGRALARGRLVDMGGVLGVQVTEILSGADRG